MCEKPGSVVVHFAIILLIFFFCLQCAFHAVLVWSRVLTQVTLVYFCVTGLDLLGKLSACSEADKARVKQWVLAQQVLPADGISGLW